MVLLNNVKLRDIVVAMGCTTNTNYIHQFDLPGDFAPLASFDLMRRAVSKCEEMKVPYHVGNIFSSDVFYSNDSVNTRWNEMGILAVEMGKQQPYILMQLNQERMLWQYVLFQIML